MEPGINHERMITFLQETLMFGKLEPADIMEVIHMIEIRQYKAGDIIVSEVNPAMPGSCSTATLWTY
jgi:hypothetical protein